MSAADTRRSCSHAGYPAIKPNDRSDGDGRSGYGGLRGTPESIENNYRRSDTPAIVRGGRSAAARRLYTPQQNSQLPSTSYSTFIAKPPSLSLSSSIHISLACGLRSREMAIRPRERVSPPSTRWSPRFKRCTLVRATPPRYSLVKCTADVRDERVY